MITNKLSIYRLVAVQCICMMLFSGCQTPDVRAKLSELVGWDTNPTPPDPDLIDIVPPEITDRLPLPPIQCLKDEHGNSVKAIVRSHLADVRGFDGSLLESLPLMAKRFAFSTGDTVKIGADPRRSAIGIMNEQDVFLTGSMQWVRVDSSTLPLRTPLEGFTSLDDFKARSLGVVVPATFTEVQLGTSGRSGWMPILGIHQLQIGNGPPMRVLEIGGFTLDSRSSAKSQSATLQPLDQETLQQLRQVDLVICIDTTGSMIPAWATVTTRLQELIDWVFGKRDIAIQVAIVAYRDSDPASRWTKRVSQFSKDPKRLETWLSQLKPGGGGDDPELMFPALEKAVEMLIGRKNGALKSVLVVADAPSHTEGAEPIDSVARSIVKTCSEHGVSISTLRVPYDKGFTFDRTVLPQQFEFLARSTNGMQFELVGDSDSSQIAQRIGAFLQRGVKDVVEVEVQIAQQLSSGLSTDELAILSDLPPTAFQWRADNVKRRLAGRLNIDEHRSLGVDRFFILWDANALTAGALVRKEELDALIAVLDSLLTIGVEKPESLALLWERIAGVNVGEDLPLSEGLRSQGIPIKESGLLAIRATELIVAPRAARLLWAADVSEQFKRLVAWQEQNRPDDNGNYIIPVSVLP